MSAWVGFMSPCFASWIFIGTGFRLRVHFALNQKIIIMAFSWSSLTIFMLCRQWKKQLFFLICHFFCRWGVKKEVPWPSKPGVDSLQMAIPTCVWTTWLPAGEMVSPSVHSFTDSDLISCKLFHRSFSLIFLVPSH